MNGRNVKSNAGTMDHLHQMTSTSREPRLDLNHRANMLNQPNQKRRSTARKPIPAMEVLSLGHQQTDGQNTISMTRGTPQTMNSTPTSLANLAQLSGITLVPVFANKAHFTSKERSGNIQRQPVNISANTIRQSAPQIITHSLTPRKIVVSSNAGFNQYQVDQHGLNIPSIHSLDGRTPIDHQGVKLNNDISGRSKPRHINNSRMRSDKTPSHKTGLMGSQPNSTTASDHHNYNCPSNDGVITELIASSLQSSHLTDNFGARKRTNHESPLTCKDHDDNDFGSNDMGLLRLMAVLNNPALTLTPVDAVSSASRDKSKGSQRLTPESKERDISNHIRSNSDQVSLSTNSHMSESHRMISTGSSNLERSLNRSPVKLPKSTVNLLATSKIDQSVVETQDAFGVVSSGASLHNEQPKTDDKAALDWLSKLALSTFKDVSGPVTLSWTPGTDMQSELCDMDIPKTDTEQVCKQPETNQSISVQLLQQLAGQVEADENHNSTDLNMSKAPIFEPECVPNVSRVNLQQLDKGARCHEITYTVLTDAIVSDKPEKETIAGSRDRIFNKRQVCPKEIVDLSPIHVEATQQKEVLVSERHLMLEKMVEIAETVGQRKLAPLEPDDIFVNRSKRIMSRIDTVLERKKRRRFERICHSSLPRELESENQSDTSDDDSIFDDSMELTESIVVPIQLPLEEKLSKEKRDYLAEVGLISRNDKNKLLIQRCEKRLHTVSAIALQESEFASEDMKRFVDTIVKTGGTDIQMRTETNIKRNELPFIEGLNRNTSRVKMNYMSALGLDKRSKRTTLYKVTRPQEKAILPGPSQQQNQQNDLIKKQQTKMPVNSLAKISQNFPQNIQLQTNKTQIRIEADLIAKMVQLPKASCRETIQVPKDEYMRSLGLMAS